MKILLIDPPFYRFIGYYNRYFPLGLAYLAAVLREEGHEVLIYDADCNVNPSKMDFTRLEDSYPLYLKSLNSKSLHAENAMIYHLNQAVTRAFSIFFGGKLCKKGFLHL